ncbi:hypothetical protein MNBD_NITROSPINAE01-1737 [hydrothermal vent metagenome]|uniref:Uncharacterized protein n=1 Tax=hydrothermal vent metagenome TaxID=652676 RepID=A0A3B1CE54_9ZZZZ
MNNTLLSAGLFVFGFTLLFLMPAGMMRTWKELGSKPIAGETTVLIMRFMGLLLIVAGVLFLLGIIDMASFVPPDELKGAP